MINVDWRASWNSKKLHLLSPSVCDMLVAGRQATHAVPSFCPPSWKSQSRRRRIQISFMSVPASSPFRLDWGKGEAFGAVLPNVASAPSFISFSVVTRAREGGGLGRDLYSPVPSSALYSSAVEQFNWLSGGGSSCTVRLHFLHVHRSNTMITDPIADTHPHTQRPPDRWQRKRNGNLV